MTCNALKKVPSLLLLLHKVARSREDVKEFCGAGISGRFYALVQTVSIRMEVPGRGDGLAGDDALNWAAGMAG